jgi:phenylacetate-CoA ligase
MVVVRGLNLFPTMVAAVLGRFPELTGDYRIVLGPPPHDRLPLRVERREGIPDDPALADRIAAAVKRELGATATVEVLPPGSFPVTEGKTARVIRSRP